MALPSGRMACELPAQVGARILVSEDGREGKEQGELCGMGSSSDEEAGPVSFAIPGRDMQDAQGTLEELSACSSSCIYIRRPLAEVATSEELSPPSRPTSFLYGVPSCWLN